MRSQSPLGSTIPTLFSKLSWKQKIATVANMVRQTNDSLRALSVPERFASATPDLLLMTDYYDVAMDELVAGIRNGDSAMLNSAADNLVAGDEAGIRATDKFFAMTIPIAVPTIPPTNVPATAVP